MKLETSSGSALEQKTRELGSALREAPGEGGLLIELSEQNARGGFLAAAAAADGYAVKQLTFSSRSCPGGDRVLLSYFTEYGLVSGAQRLSWDFLAYDEDEAARFSALLHSCGWSEPVTAATLFRVNANGLSLDESVCKNAELSAGEGEIVPFVGLPYSARARFMLKNADKTGDYLRLDALSGIIPELSLAYTKNGELEGFYICTDSGGGLELRMAYMPEKAKAYTVLMIQRLLEQANKMYGRVPELRICAVSAAAEKLTRRVFEKRITKTALLLSGEFKAPQADA